MREVEFILRVQVDPEAAREHVERRPDNYPLVADESEWTYDDLEAALAEGIAEDPEIAGFFTMPREYDG